MTSKREPNRLVTRLSRSILNLIGFLVVLSFLFGILFTFTAFILTILNYYYEPMIEKDLDFRFPMLLSIIGFLFILATWLLDRVYSWGKKELITNANDAAER